MSDTPVAECYPSGQCGPEMMERGFSSETGDPVAGGKIYVGQCATCHGPAGKGGVKSGKVDMTAVAWQSKMSDTAIANVIRSGRPPLMPPFALSQKDLRDVVAHIRTLKAAAPTTVRGGY